MLVGRHRECGTLDRLIKTVSAGESQALVVVGEAGVGKTALLDYVAAQASGCQLIRAAGVQSEMELPFAAVHQLCAPLLSYLERLPSPQRSVLQAAFGLTAGSRPDQFLVGLAVLGLLAEVARDRPLVCVVDDVQWLDRASAGVLAFVARRLVAESVALIFAVRADEELRDLEGLAALQVDGLAADDARALLATVVRGLDERVADRIVAETRGNPLALLEMPRGLTPAELTVGFVLPTARDLPNRIELCYRQRCDGLPAETQRLLLIAACEPLGDPVLVWRAGELLGVGTHAARPAVESGLLRIDTQVRFQHPLVRSAIYQAAAPPQRRAAHHALAQATDPEVDPDRRAWHRAQATVGPDEDVAEELEWCAARAQTRGGPAASAALLHRATELTADPARRAGRALTAAHATYQAGEPATALNLLSVAENGPLDQLQRAKADVLRAQLTFIDGRMAEVSPLLLRAAGHLTELNVAAARETYLEALFAAWVSSPLTNADEVRSVARAARAAPSPQSAPRAIDLLLDGLAIRLTEGYAAGAPILRRALEVALNAAEAEEPLRSLTFALYAAVDVWDERAWELISARQVRRAREIGAFSELPLALIGRIWAHLQAGDISAAESTNEELRALKEATGSQLAPYGSLAVAAWRGDEALAAELFAAINEHALWRGEGSALAAVQWAKAQFYNGLGRYQDALTSVEPCTEHPHITLFGWSGLVELVEAATRCGRPELAATALEQLAEPTLASGTSWALGIEARSRALLAEGSAAEDAYQESLAHLGRSRVHSARARVHLLYGEWLRRNSRRSDARSQLRTAHEMFNEMGAQAFAQRAARELDASGETARRRSAPTTSELTAQEEHIVRLVREGLSNTEVGARLFISPRTVEWHLSQIFNKLHITSRRQLRKCPVSGSSHDR